jgi:hypothetical protein
MMEYKERYESSSENAARLLAKMEGNRTYLWVVVAILNMFAIIALLDSIHSF